MKISNRDKQNTFKVVLLVGEIGLSYESGTLFIGGNHLKLYFLYSLESDYASLCMPYQTEGTFIFMLI